MPSSELAETRRALFQTSDGVATLTEVPQTMLQSREDSREVRLDSMAPTGFTGGGTIGRDQTLNEHEGGAATRTRSTTCSTL